MKRTVKKTEKRLRGSCDFYSSISVKRLCERSLIRVEKHIISEI